MSDNDTIRAILQIQNLCYWLLYGGDMPQPYFCFDLNGYTLGNKDCTGCNKCGGKK